MREIEAEIGRLAAGLWGLSKVVLSQLSDEQLRLVLGENIARLLGL